MAALDTTFALTPVGGTATTVTVNAPACNSGDLLVLAALGGATAAVNPSTPTGWAALSAGGAALGVFTKTAGAAEPPVTVTFSAACCASVIMASFPASTVAQSSFTSSGTNVVTWTPTFPGGVTGEETVLLIGGPVVSLAAPDNLSGSANMNFPATWLWDVPPIGPSFTNYSPGPAVVTLGMASFRGSTSNPVVTSTSKAQFFTGLIVLDTVTPEQPWLKITATAAGNAGLGTALTVKALTGADTVTAIDQTGAVATATGKTGAAQVAITPVRSGSLLFGAAWSAAPGAAYTANAATTFTQNVYDPVNKAAYGTFRSASAVPAGTAVTVGASAPTSAATDMAVAEILTTSALGTTATAAVSATAAGQYAGPQPSQTVTFTSMPPAGQLLVATVVAGTQNAAPDAGPVTVSLTDTAGLAWTELVSSTANGHGYAGVWAAQAGVTTAPPGVPTGLTVTGVTATSVSLAWAAPAQGPVTGYDVFVNGLKNLSPAGTAATVTNLSPGTTYSFTVDAFNTAGASSQTSPVPGTTTGAPPPPPQSTGSGALFGLRPVPAAGVSPETDFRSSVIARELLLGRKLDIVTTWRNWDPATENTTAELQCIQGGRLPMLTWPLPANVPAGAAAGITAGTYDQVIYGWGVKLAALGGRVLFRPMPGANTDPVFGPDPAVFIAAWRRIWTIVKGSAAQFAALSPPCTVGPAISAGNVDFVWSMAHRGADLTPPPPRTGADLVGMFNVTPTATVSVNLNTNVGPNALLASSSYPLPSVTGTSVGPLTHIPTPGRGFFIIDGSTEASEIENHWPSGSGTTYTSNNNASNTGGTVPAGGMTIDGYPVPAGTKVFQFMNFNATFSVVSPGPSVLFRGCRFRGGVSAPGVFNCGSGWSGDLNVHYSDVGGNSATAAAETGIDSSVGSNMRVLRCYLSYIGTSLQPNMGAHCDIVENFVEKITLGNSSWHLNGMTFNGGNRNFLVLRNRIVTAANDDAGRSIGQTDCISMFQDFGTFPGTGTNSDGSTGYFITGNLVGGTGYCFYLGQNAGTAASTVQHLTFTGNLVTTASFPNGGFFGAAAAIPTWGTTFHNTEANNTWFDGPNAGHDILA